MTMMPLAALALLLGCPTTPPTDDSAGDTADDTGAEINDDTDPFGSISGDCGVLDTELTDAAPSLFDNAIDFEGDFDYDALTPGGQEVHDDGNLGGSSLYSEIIAYELLDRCEDAVLLKTEGEIVYDSEGTRTDLLVELDGTRIGVSVVRAFQYPPGTPLEVPRATELLEDKLSDILESSDLVSDADAWNKQILSVIAYDDTAAESITTAWGSLEADVRADTIVYVTVTDGSDDWVY